MGKKGTKLTLLYEKTSINTNDKVKKKGNVQSWNYMIWVENHKPFGIKHSRDGFSGIVVYHCTCQLINPRCLMSLVKSYCVVNVTLSLQSILLFVACIDGPMPVIP